MIAYDFMLSKPFLFFIWRFWRSVLAFYDKVICFMLEVVLLCMALKGDICEMAVLPAVTELPPLPLRVEFDLSR